MAWMQQRQAAIAQGVWNGNGGAAPVPVRPEPPVAVVDKVARGFDTRNVSSITYEPSLEGEGAIAKVERALGIELVHVKLTDTAEDGPAGKKGGQLPDSDAARREFRERRRL